MTKSDLIIEYWENFISTLPENSVYNTKRYISEKWGNSNRMASDLAALLKNGSKKAACSSVWEFEESGDEIPKPGLITIILDGNDVPQCIVETVDVIQKKFYDVDLDFILAEGEGFKTVESWRDAHWDYFGETLGKFGKNPQKDMPLICEYFKVIYNK